MSKYKEGDVVKARITAIEKYGAFASIDDEYSGLIHISEITDKYVRDITDFIEIGEIINVKILSISSEHNQLRLSVKDVNEDLRESKRKNIKETVFGFYMLKTSLPNWIRKKMEEINKNS